jgi:2'-hydroxyisoflavone reductase
LNLLVLGGTRFLGRHLVQAALERGDRVTLFNRGRTNPELFPRAEKLRGDRTSDVSALRERRWDAVVDVATFLPRVVRLSVDALRDRIERYVYVSSVSVYADQSVPPVEGAAVTELADPHDERVDSYGALKAACEPIVEEAFGERALLVRPGLIVGPTTRPTASPGGPAGSPPAGACSLRATRTIRSSSSTHETWPPGCCARPKPGSAASSTRPGSDGLSRLPRGMPARDRKRRRARLRAERAAPCGRARGVDGAPLWIASPGWQAANLEVSKAIEAGLTFRPLEETIRDTLAWDAASGRDRHLARARIAG